MAKPRRNDTPKFKAEAVGRIATEGKSLAEVARKLRLGESLLRSWKVALAAHGEPAFPSKGNPPAGDEELRRLRAENHQLRMERDLFTKATAFFARQSSSDPSSSRTTTSSGQPG